MIALCAAAAAPAAAALSPVSAGETVLFSDDFDNNDAGWSDVVTTAAAGKAFIGTDPGSTGASVWYPSLDSNGSRVTSNRTFTQALDFSKGAVAGYFRVRVDDVNDTTNNEFHLGFKDANTNRFVEFDLHPGGSGRLFGRDAGGGGAQTATSSFTMPSTSEFVDFRMEVRNFNSSTGAATVEAFRHNGTSYITMGTATNINLGSGVWEILEVSSRNNTDGLDEQDSNRAFFDSVVVTQVPEPAGVGMVAAGALAVLARRVRRTS